MNTALRSALLAGALMGLAGGTAHALPNALAYDYFGLNYADNVQTSSAIGVFSYIGEPGCGGTCTATTTLGADPSTSLTVNEVSYDGAGGGGSDADLAYYFEYINAPGSYVIDLHASDEFTANIASYPGYSDAQDTVLIGTAGLYPKYINNFLTYLYTETDCINGCESGVANYTTPHAIPAVVPLTIAANTVYEIELETYIGAGDLGVTLTAGTDPTLTTTATGGHFLFSPGVISSAPEPTTWALMLVGFGGLGGLARRRRNAALASA